MNTRTFGRTPLPVSTIGLGTWPIGGARYGPRDDAAARRAVRAALDRGVTCFDTAPSYGNGHAESLLGETLGARRRDVCVVTKGGLVWNARSEVLGRDSRPDTLRAQIEASLRRLRTHYVDLYLIHWPDPATPIEDAAAALAGLVRAGKARYAGVSNFQPLLLRACAAALGETPLAASQVGFSLFDDRWARATFDACLELGAGVMAYGPLAHGLLAGAVTRTTVFDDSDWRARGMIFGQPLLSPEHRERNLAVVDRLGAIAARERLTLPQLALRWVLSHPVVTVALVGARTAGEIEEAAGASGPGIEAGVMREIEDVMRDAAGRSSELPA